MKKYYIFDLFAGCGGLSQGFLDVGNFNIPIANEFWKPAQLTYAQAHKDTHLFEEDIKELTNDKIKKELKKQKIKNIDIIIGGPPCQGFSMAGKRWTKDPRNKLFVEFARIVDFLKPKFFIFENVKGLLTMKDTSGNFVISEIVKEFEKVDGGYYLTYKILNSADYGVPQKRERIILIGTRLKKLKNKILHPSPTHYPTDIKDLKVWVKRNSSFFEFSNKTLKEVVSLTKTEEIPIEIEKVIKKLKPWTTSESVIKDLETIEDEADNFNHKPMSHTPIVKKRMSLIKEGGNIPNDQKEWPKELRRKRFASVYRRIHRKEPTPTMVPGHSAFPIHYKFNRSLTVREAARIQTLPDKYKFFGSKSDQCLVVGNAVPTLMAKNIAKKIKEILNNN